MGKASLIGAGAIGLAVSVMLSGCSEQISAKQAVAKCELEVLSDAGIAWRTNYAAQWNRDEEKAGFKWGDTSYRQYFSKCMAVEGFSFAKRGDRDRACWGGGTKENPTDDFWVSGCWER